MERPMNIRTSPRRLAAYALLGTCAICAPSAAALSLFDVIQMTQGGYEEAEIIRLMDVTGARFELDAEGLKALKEAEVSPAIIRRLLDDGGVAPDAHSTVDAAALSMLLEAGFEEATILKFVRHRKMCEPLDEEAADELADAGFSAPFFDGFQELVAECQASRLALAPVESALPPGAYAEQPAPAQTTHTVIIREAPDWHDHLWRDRYYDRLHYRRYPAWYPVYIYRDHRARNRHRHDRRHRLDRDRRHRGDRDWRRRNWEDRDRRRRHAGNETERGEGVATRPRRSEPWVSTRPGPLDGPPTRLLPAPSGHTVTTSNGTPAPVPTARRPATVSTDVVAGPAPGALSGLPIKSASPRGLSPVAAPRDRSLSTRRAAPVVRRPTLAAPTVRLPDRRALPVRRTVPPSVPRQPVVTARPRPPTAAQRLPSRAFPQNARPAMVPRSTATPRPVRAAAPSPRVAPSSVAIPRPVALPRRDMAPRAPRRAPRRDEAQHR